MSDECPYWTRGSYFYNPPSLLSTERITINSMVGENHSLIKDDLERDFLLLQRLKCFINAYFDRPGPLTGGCLTKQKEDHIMKINLGGALAKALSGRWSIG